METVEIKFVNCLSWDVTYVTWRCKLSIILLQGFAGTTKKNEKNIVV